MLKLCVLMEPKELTMSMKENKKLNFYWPSKVEDGVEVAKALHKH